MSIYDMQSYWFYYVNVYKVEFWAWNEIPNLIILL